MICLIYLCSYFNSYLNNYLTSFLSVMPFVSGLCTARRSAPCFCPFIAQRRFCYRSDRASLQPAGIGKVSIFAKDPRHHWPLINAGTHHQAMPGSTGESGFTHLDLPVIAKQQMIGVTKWQGITGMSIKKPPSHP